MANQLQPIVVQHPSQAPGYGSQIVIGALAGVLAWWLIETITSSRAAAAAEVDDADE